MKKNCKSVIVLFAVVLPLLTNCAPVALLPYAANILDGMSQQQKQHDEQRRVQQQAPWTPPQQQVVPPAEDVVEVTGNAVNIRSEPSTQGKIVCVAKAGQILKKIAPEPKSGWIHVSLNDETGWISEKFIR